MPDKRLPSFNDFSPVILRGDIRDCLRIIANGGGDDEKVIQQWAAMYFDGKSNKRSSTNIPATLWSTGLTTGSRPMTLSEIGLQVLNAPSPEKAAELFCAHIVRERNGDALLQALRALNQRQVAPTKLALQQELVKLGVVGLSTNTTDHTTLKNWMRVASIIGIDERPNEAVVKKILGVTTEEADELASLPLAHQVFLQLLRREHLTGPGPVCVHGVIPNPQPAWHRCPLRDPRTPPCQHEELIASH